MSKYNCYFYWYINAYTFQALDVRHGTFCSRYSLYPWWSSHILKIHIQCGDIDRRLLVQNAIWHTYAVLSIPYTYFKLPPKKPPDRYISRFLILVLLLIMSLISVIFSLFKIIGLKFGLISYPKPSTESTTPPDFLDMAFTTVHVLTASELARHVAFSTFDADTQTALVDNCANTHIWNNCKQFKTFTLIPASKRGVSTIGGTPHHALGMGDVSVTWKDDNGQIFYHTLKNVLYFPNSPVNIISCSKLAEERGGLLTTKALILRASIPILFSNGSSKNIVDALNILTIVYPRWL